MRASHSAKNELLFTLRMGARILARFSAGILIAAVVLFILAPVLFFSVPEFNIGGSQVRSLLDRYSPASVAIQYTDLDLQVTRVPGETFAKHLSLKADRLCVRYNQRVVDACFSKVAVGFSFGWGGPRPSGETWLFPRLVSIDPLEFLGGIMNVDLNSLPPVSPSGSKFDLFGILQNQILPKWKMSGSRIEIQKFELITGDAKDLHASFDLSTDEFGRVRVELHDLTMAGSPLRAHAELSLHKPTGARPLAGKEIETWKLLVDGFLNIDSKKGVQVRADADIQSWRELVFNVRSVWHGVDFLHSIDLDGHLKNEKVDGRISLATDDGRVAGGKGRLKKLRNFQALSLVKCLYNADVGKSVLDLDCGPETVRLSLQQKAFLKNPSFFTFAPQFKLQAKLVAFGKTKAADFTLGLKIDHFDLINAETELKGSVKQGPNGPLQYTVNGDLNFLIRKFGRLTALLKDTPYAFPAPLNVMTGPVELKTQVKLTEAGGEIEYQASTKLDSDVAHAQSVHLRAQGKTTLSYVENESASAAGKSEKVLRPLTDVTILVDELHIAAPRFDLRKPPAFKPDPRFKLGSLKPLEEEALAREQEKSLAEQMPPDIHLHIKTTQAQAIQIATNLTKNAIPIDLDLIYGKLPARNGIIENGVTGDVIIGRTSVDLFKRNAVVDHFRFDLLPSGEQRVDGKVSVTYLDYDIHILLLGNLKEPIVKFESVPPVDDNQILAVLIFGRPLNELSADQQNSVSSLNAAVADAALSVSSLYVLASTPIESVGYDPSRQMVSARVGLGGGASLELGSGKDTSSSVGFQKRLNKDFTFRTEVDTITSSGKRTVTALVEWVKRF